MLSKLPVVLHATHCKVKHCKISAHRPASFILRLPPTKLVDDLEAELPVTKDPDPVPDPVTWRQENLDVTLIPVFCPAYQQLFTCHSFSSIRQVEYTTCSRMRKWTFKKKNRSKCVSRFLRLGMGYSVSLDRSYKVKRREGCEEVLSGCRDGFTLSYDSSELSRNISTILRSK